MEDIKIIRKAITNSRGGWEDRTDEEVMRIWDSLGSKIQKIYLKTAEKEVQNATSDRPEPDIQTDTKLRPEQNAATRI